MENNIEDGVIPTREALVDDLSPNWIDSAATTVTKTETNADTGEETTTTTINETVGNAVWEPFTTDEGLLGGEEKLTLEIVKDEESEGEPVTTPIDEIEDLVKGEADDSGTVDPVNP